MHVQGASEGPERVAELRCHCAHKKKKNASCTYLHLFHFFQFILIEHFLVSRIFLAAEDTEMIKADHTRHKASEYIFKKFTRLGKVFESSWNLYLICFLTLKLV